MNSPILLGFFLLSLGIIFLVWYNTYKDRFEIAERRGMICPTVNFRDTDLLPPGIILLVVQGYNYTNTPIIYRNGERVYFEQYSWDEYNLSYYIMVYGDLKTDYWYIELSEFVEPQITEGYTQQAIKTTYMGGKYGHYMWELKVR